MAAAFVSPALTAATGATAIPSAVALVLCAALLSLGTIVVFPFEMDTIVELAGDRLVATHYGLYNTIVGTGILLGNLGTGTALDLARRSGLPVLPWLVLAVVGAACAWCLHRLDGGGHLTRTKAAHMRM
jgi:hypothetical protein